MTAEEWLTCSDLRLMLEQHHVTSNARKLRLFVVACCKGMEHLLYPESLAVLAIAERFADGLATARELCLARDAAREMEKRFKWERGRHPQERRYAAQAARLAGNEDLRDRSSLDLRDRIAHAVIDRCESALRCEAGWKSRCADSSSKYVPLLREVYGNPSRPVTLPRTGGRPTSPPSRVRRMTRGPCQGANSIPCASPSSATRWRKRAAAARSSITCAVRDCTSAAAGRST
jgi:hypothetical protein